MLAGPDSRLPSPQSYAGVTLVMTLATFPFVYLLARAAFLNLNVSYEEVARACGVSRAGTLLRVTLPLMRPAIVAGLSLVVLYVVSDFGAVSLLRYQTLTYAVYQQITGRYDPTAASILEAKKDNAKVGMVTTTIPVRGNIPRDLSPLRSLPESRA